MRFRKVLRQLELLLLFFTLCLLFGCVSPNGLLSNDGLGDQTPQAYHAPSHNSIVKADNVASKDYFQNTSAPPPTQNDTNNLWSAIRTDFKLNHYADSPQVQAQIAWYMHNQGYLDRTTRRAAPFMYYIYQSVKARHLPAELVLLPIIESAYNPFVSSSAGAAGLWQIEPGTGRTFGLKQDFWYDGRRDITTSTGAALDYLSYLQNMFGGNWLLALAAYDSGEGSVAAAMRRNAREGASTEFWALGLPRETQAYVPRLLALAVIVSDPEKYQIDLPPISNAAYLGQVDISPRMTLDRAANLSGISLSELKILNPGYRRNASGANHPYHLLLPIDRISTFKKNLLDDSETSNATNGLWSHYKVQPRDTWRKLASRFNTTEASLKSINHLEAHIPPVGSILLIPETKTNAAALANATAEEAEDTDTTNTDTDNDETQNTPSPDLSDAASLDKSAMDKLDKQNAKTTKGLHLYREIHLVKHNETLATIAKSHGVSEEELAKWNHLSAHAKLKPGEKLILWKKAPEKETSSETHHHRVAQHHLHHRKHS
jgi:membrane-bound lytic murein transglycosylase D